MLGEEGECALTVLLFFFLYFVHIVLNEKCTKGGCLLFDNILIHYSKRHIICEETHSKAYFAQWTTGHLRTCLVP